MHAGEIAVPESAKACCLGCRFGGRVTPLPRTKLPRIDIWHPPRRGKKPRKFRTPVEMPEACVRSVDSIRQQIESSGQDCVASAVCFCRVRVRVARVCRRSVVAGELKEPVEN